MPGWGTGSFENEDAQSFLARLNSLGVDDLRQILTHAADQDYLEAPESGAAVAAAEVVAALVVSAKGMAAKEETSSPATAPQIVDWIRKNGAGTPPDLVALAPPGGGEGANQLRTQRSVARGRGIERVECGAARVGRKTQRLSARWRIQCRCDRRHLRCGAQLGRARRPSLHHPQSAAATPVVVSLLSLALAFFSACRRRRARFEGKPASRIL